MQPLYPTRWRNSACHDPEEVLTWSSGTLTMCAEIEVVAIKLPDPCCSKMGPTAFIA